MKNHKKLIEVSLPLDAINKAAAREKSIRHDHPSTLHLWWARRPLAAARAVIFAQMVDDPSSYVDVDLAAQPAQDVHDAPDAAFGAGGVGPDLGMHISHGGESSGETEPDVHPGFVVAGVDPREGVLDTSLRCGSAHQGQVLG